MTTEKQSAGRLSVLRNRNFTLLFAGSLVSNAGSWMQLVAQGWLVYHLSGSPFLLGLIGLSRALPIIVIAPFGGVIADRVDRVRLLKITQIASMVLAFIPAVLLSLGTIQIWHLMVISLLGSAVNAFDNPTRQALLPDLVRQEDLSKAIALNSSAWNGAALFGPALAGITIAAIGVEGAFYANAVSFVAVVAALYMLRGVPERSAATSKKTIGEDFIAGIEYVRSKPFIMTLLGLAAITSIFGRSYQHLLPVFASDVLHGGSAGLGFLMSAPGAGTLVGALGIATLKDIRLKGPAFILGMLMFSVSVLLFSINRSFGLALVLLFFSGFAQLTFSTMMSTMLQVEVPGAMRGRVMALQAVTFQGFHPLGALVTGSVATMVGTPTAVGISAVIVAVSAVITLLMVPSIRNYAATEAEVEMLNPTGGVGARVPSAAPVAVSMADSSGS